MRMPASVAHSLPAATAPCTPRTGCRNGRSGSRLVCATLKTASAKIINTLLCFMSTSGLSLKVKLASLYSAGRPYNGLAVDQNSQQQLVAEPRRIDDQEPML